MKLFVIHRFKDRKHAKKKLKKLAQDLSLEFQPIFLDSSGGEEWKQKAESAISQVEATIVFNPSSCEESDNTKWEIEKAKGRIEHFKKVRKQWEEKRDIWK